MPAALRKDRDNVIMSTGMRRGRRGRFLAVLSYIVFVILVIAILFGALLVFLTVTEFRPSSRAEAEITGFPSAKLSPGDEFTVATWNIGYGALGDNADFFMDGGTHVHTADRERVDANMRAIISGIAALNPDILLLQETDRDSLRSHHVDEYTSIGEGLAGYTSSFANNFKVAFLPYPVPPIGKVDSGIATYSSYGVSSAERVQLPIPFSWPMRMANLKRCVLVSRIPVEGTDKELVLFNLHLEAYDSGEGKIAQTKMLAELLYTEAEKGNYVIAGGDFNQIFSSADGTRYAAQPGMWTAGEIDVTEIKGDWQFLMDERVPTCRSLDQPYFGADKESFQYYLIDGFIVSGNITVDTIETQDLGFTASDHNPVLLKATLN